MFTHELTQHLLDIETFQAKPIVQSPITDSGAHLIAGSLQHHHNIILTTEAVQNIIKLSNAKPRKALRSYIFKTRGVSLNTMCLAFIDDVISRWNTKLIPTSSANVDINITQDLDWEVGTYGDNGSCLFTGDYPLARDCIVDNDGFAITFDFFEARCWAMPLDSFVTKYGNRPQLQNAYGIFNAYGINLEAFAEYFITILADETKQEYRSTVLELDRKKETHLIYMNTDSVLLVYPTASENIVNRITKHKVGFLPANTNISQTFATQYSCYCEACSEGIHEDDAYYVDDCGYICEHCYDNEYFTCAECCNIFDNHRARKHENGDTYCEECAEDHTWCNDCNLLVDDFVHVEDSGEIFCHDCIDNNAYECEECDTYVSTAAIHNIDGTNVCDDCLDDYLDKVEETA